MPRPLGVTVSFCLLTLFPLLAQTPSDATAARGGITSPTWVRSRAVWFSQDVNPVAAEVCVGCEAAPWDAAVQKAWDAGGRVALGGRSWATLDSFTGLTVGKDKLAKGCYYLALEKGRNGWSLVVLDPVKVQKAQLLPAAAGKERALARWPLQASEGTAANLGFVLEPEAGGARLTLHWGTHVLSAQLEVQGSVGNSPIAQQDARGSSRLSLGGGKAGHEAFAQLDHGAPAWSDARTAEAQKLPKNGRWRLGQNWWTTLDCNSAIDLGGKKLAAGIWHLSLKKTGDDSWHLLCTPAADDVGGQLDAFAVDYSKAAFEVPLTMGKAGQATDKLAIAFVQDGAGRRLAIDFGEHELSAAMAP